MISNELTKKVLSFSEKYPSQKILSNGTSKLEHDYIDLIVDLLTYACQHGYPITKTEYHLESFVTIGDNYKYIRLYFGFGFYIDLDNQTQYITTYRIDKFLTTRIITNVVSKLDKDVNALLLLSNVDLVSICNKWAGGILHETL